jgi:hypothetical protein
MSLTEEKFVQEGGVHCRGDGGFESGQVGFGFHAER